MKCQNPECSVGVPPRSSKYCSRLCRRRTYERTPKGKAIKRRWRKSLAGKASQKRYDTSAKGKEKRLQWGNTPAAKRWRLSPEGKEWTRKYQTRPEAKARRKRWAKSPVGKLKIRKMQRSYFDKIRNCPKRRAAWTARLKQYARSPRGRFVGYVSMEVYLFRKRTNGGVLPRKSAETIVRIKEILRKQTGRKRILV